VARRERGRGQATTPLGGIPVVAIVGRPNVGKSTLFNRIVGERAAIVEDRARTTRDRLYAESIWNGRRFLLVDTGGLELDPDDPIEARVQVQARIAIAEADVIVFVVDAITGLTPADQEAAEILRRATAPVIVAANKSDNAKRELDAAEFWALGWERTHAIASIHGRGVADLLDEIVLALPPESAEELARRDRAEQAEAFARDVEDGRLQPFIVGEDDGFEALEDDGDAALELAFDSVAEGTGSGSGASGGSSVTSRSGASGRPGVDPAAAARWDAMMAAESDESPPAVALVGRPNVGKSSLLNALIGEQRMIVSEVPGTTRDAIDTRLAWGRTEIVLIDTAGIRRRGKVASGPAAERFSTLRSLRAISRADVAVLLVDAVEGLTSQDAHIAGYVVEEGRGLVVAVNKWDAVEGKTGQTFDQYTEWIRTELPFLDFAPIVSISAKTGLRIDKVLELAVDVWAERRRRISTGELNRVVQAAVERQEPPMVKGRRPKIFYATQASVAPPTFVFFARDAGSVHFSYQRFLENRIRDEFGFLGTPIRLVFRERSAAQIERRRTKAGARGAARGGTRAKAVRSGAATSGSAAARSGARGG
jgi:GTP-binding protein